METTACGYCHKCDHALTSSSLLCPSCSTPGERPTPPRRENNEEKAQCRAFRDNLSVEDRGSFDALLREPAPFIQAGALDPDLMLSEVLAVSLSLAIYGQLEKLRDRVSDLEE